MTKALKDLTPNEKIARAIRQHVKYVKSFSRTGVWASNSGNEYWNERMSRSFSATEVKNHIDKHMAMTVKKIKAIK